MGLFDNRRPTGNRPRPLPNESEEMQKEDPKEVEYLNRAAIFQSKLEDWEGEIRKEARQKYDNDREKAKKDAETNTVSVVDTTEMSLLRGQGPKFVLEFTALIVIIFLAVILGVLGRLDSQQIGTLLAAIAGYVLGKATTSQAPAQVPAQTPAPPAAKAEEQGRASGRAA